MSGSPPLRVPVGHDAERWSTFRGERVLVVAARTLTSTVRVLEVLPALLRGDDRVIVVFAYDPTSAFNDGVVDLLRGAGCRVMPWEQVGSIKPDLVLSASENIDVPEGDCPVLVLPHGVGFQKLVPDSRAQGTRLSGMVAEPLLEAGRGWLAVSHPDQEKQLLAAYPKIAGRTLLTGDPCFDELVVSLPEADAYRRALGVGDRQRLVVVSSTWGPTSLIGQDPGLPARLLAELPLDEYRVAAILHPNVWSGHGSWQIRTLLAAALEAGLLLIPPAHVWRPALVAAHVTIADHGSVGLYSASLDKPLLLAAFGSDSVPGTAVDALRQAAPRLDARRALLPQIEDVIGGHAPGRYARVAERAFAEPGQALAKLRTVLFRLMKLPERRDVAPPVLTLAVPEPLDPATADVTSWMTATTVSAHSGQWAVAVRRYPASVARDFAEEADTFWHLACDERERDTRLTESASVLVRRIPATAVAGAVRWIRDTLDRFPGCWIAAAALGGGSCLVGLRDAGIVEATATGTATDPGLSPAVVYACLRKRIPMDDTVVTLRAGEGHEEDVALRLMPRRVNRRL